MKKIYIILIVVIIFVVALISLNKNFLSTIKNEPIVCTQESKICPDGSYVGRTGPNCEFTKCPDVSTSAVKTISSNGDVILGIGEKARLGDFNITFNSFQDSRCPVGVVCIQAGTVRANVTLVLGSKNQVTEINYGQTVKFEGYIVSIVSAFPASRPGQQLPKSDYKITFNIVRK